MFVNAFNVKLNRNKNYKSKPPKMHKLYLNPIYLLKGGFT